MTELTTCERIKRVYDHKMGDRVPVTDIPWKSTIARWRREGIPEGVSYDDFFGLDKVVTIGVDNSPRFPSRIIKETPEYSVRTTSWGVTIREWTHMGGVPEFLDFTIKDPESWKRAKARMKPSRDRVDWVQLSRDYAGWREAGAWISTYWWFGFDVTHSWAVGTERLLMALVTHPEWCVDMFNTFLDLDIALFEMIWDAGYAFDEVHWPDDLGYKGTQFFSLDMYRNLLKPVHQRACDWAHKKGIKAHLHTCGNVMPLVPDLIDAGVDMLNPIEVKAGNDPVALKQKFGDRLAFHGGINAVHFTDPAKLEAEMRSIVPLMKKGGGYWLSSDHSVPDSVSVDDFRRFVALAKQLGAY